MLNVFLCFIDLVLNASLSPSQIAKNPGLTSIRYRPNIFVSEQHPIDIELRVFAILVYEADNAIKMTDEVAILLTLFYVMYSSVSIYDSLAGTGSIGSLS